MSISFHFFLEKGFISFTLKLNACKYLCPFSWVLFSLTLYFYFYSKTVKFYEALFNTFVSFAVEYGKYRNNIVNIYHTLIFFAFGKGKIENIFMKYTAYINFLADYIFYSFYFSVISIKRLLISVLIYFENFPKILFKICQVIVANLSF